MTQITFLFKEEITTSRLNQATQGYKLLRRVTYAGSSGSPTGNGITFSTNWFPGSGTSAVIVRACGGGGGGNSLSTTTTAPNFECLVGGGGGGGGYSERLILSGFGASQAVQIGLGGGPQQPGGNSLFGTFLSAGPGLAGTGGGTVDPNTQPLFFVGGLGGIGSQGNIIGTGSRGGIGTIFTSTAILSGRGGQSAFGGSGGGEVAGTMAGESGKIYGGGGGGAIILNNVKGTRLGGPGAAGFVIIDEYA